MTSLATVFDMGYFSRGISMIHSCCLVSGDRANLLGMGPISESVFDRLKKSGVDSVAEQEFLRASSDLRKRLSSRKRTEQFFTLGSQFSLTTLANCRPQEWFVYADADLYFFRPLEEYLAAFHDANVILAPHRHFAWNKKRLAKYGEFNVGLVAFRNNKEGLAALQYWADSCLEWCSDVPEDGKYADQKYLENFSKVANGVVIDDRKGVNLAPWNLGFSKLTLDENDKLMVDGEPVYYFHAQGIKRTKSAWTLGHLPYFSLASRSAKKLIYRPYLAGLLRWEEENSAAKSSSSRASKGFAALAVAIFGKTLQFLLGQVIFDSQLRRLTSDPNKRPN